MKPRHVSLVLLMVILTGPLGFGEPTPTADSLIAAAKEVTGGEAWDKIITWHEQGKLTIGGLVGQYETWTDFPSLRNSGTYTLGPSSGSQGWDGIRSWSTDSSKEVRIEASEEATAANLQDAYRSAYGFYFHNRLPDTREYFGERKADGKSFQVIRVTPKGADPFEIWFDPTTHRIDREVQLTGGHPQTFLLSDYTPVNGVTIPKKIIARVGNDPKYDTISEEEVADLSGPEEASRYAPPAPPANSAQWPAGKDSLTVPFELRNNHIYLQVSINGAAPCSFIFDTGATNFLEDSTVKSLGLKTEGTLPGGGFGNQMSPMGLTKVKSVSIGGLTLPDQVFITQDTPNLIEVEGQPVFGLVGYEFAKRAVLTIDYAKKTLTFTKASAFQPPAGVTAVPFTFNDHVPMVTAVLGGTSGEYEIDTGSRGAITVFAAFAKKNGLIEKYHATKMGTVGYGVGGPSRALLARGDTFQIGPLKIDAPVLEISTDTAGAGAVSHEAGNIGGDVLKRFTLTLDYANRLIWFQPNDNSGKPEVFDRSGMFLARAGDGGFKVLDVTSHSAAESSGITKGDEILSVNGKAAKDIQLNDLRQSFKSDLGTKFSLSVKGKGGQKDVALVLEDEL